jgi:hypothetical protein
MPTTKIAPFYEMNIDDARWMARLIGQLTEEQLKQALIGAGYDVARARFLLEKLVSRRDQMIKDIGLEGEIALLRPNGVNRRLSYDPSVDGPFESFLPEGRRVTAQNTGLYVIVKGVLQSRLQDAKGTSASRDACCWSRRDYTTKNARIRLTAHRRPSSSIRTMLAVECITDTCIAFKTSQGRELFPGTTAWKREGLCGPLPARKSTWGSGD